MAIDVYEALKSICKDINNLIDNGHVSGPMYSLMSRWNIDLDNCINNIDDDRYLKGDLKAAQLQLESVRKERDDLKAKLANSLADFLKKTPAIKRLTANEESALIGAGVYEPFLYEVYNDQLINSVKIYRNTMNVGLKEAKERVEEIMGRVP